MRGRFLRMEGQNDGLQETKNEVFDGLCSFGCGPTTHGVLMVFVFVNVFLCSEGSGWGTLPIPHPMWEHRLVQKRWSNTLRF